MSNTPFTSPHAEPTPAAQPKDNTLKIVLIVLGLILLFVLLICGGIMAAGYFFVQKVSDEFGNAMGAAFAEEYLETPEAVEALGDVKETDFNFSDMTEEGILEVRVVGTKGSGTLVLSDDEQGLPIAQLVMDDGRTIDLPTPEETYEEFEPGMEEGATNLEDFDAPLNEEALIEEPAGAN